MTFKKDYINYLLHTVVNSTNSEFRDNYRLSKLVDTIVQMDDVMKVTYLIGKTAGLENLFKYLLYISDKIDKSQITIFNLKDNFDYDVINLRKICDKISHHKSENVQQVMENIEDKMESSEIEEELKSAISINTDDSSENIVTMEESGELTEYADENEDSVEGKLTLIENKDSYTGETEVFELESITDSLENTDAVENNTESADVTAGQTDDEEDIDEEIADDETISAEETDNITDSEDEESVESTETEENTETEVFVLDDSEEIETAENEDSEDSDIEEIENDDILEAETSELELEIEVRKPSGSAQEEEHIKEETITNEAYYKFETKFFEEVKILEKLFASVDKDCRTDETGKLSDKCLQCFTEIIEITSELSSLSRQLSFDLIADIFLTMNLYTTKAISQPEILTSERIKLLDSALALVNSLIKGEDYLNYDSVVDKIEQLKQDISGEKEEKYPPEEVQQYESQQYESQQQEQQMHEQQLSEQSTHAEDEEEVSGESELQGTAEEVEKTPEPVVERSEVKESQMDSAVFKLKYLVKEFEKSFVSIENFKGEYSKFDALEKISELNNALRLIAKISAIIKKNDVLKLAEVTYVFLKYVKDYRMDLMEPEIKQIVKYIIFTFKMLLTNRKPEDFNVLVQHLNNPVKIFADS